MDQIPLFSVDLKDGGSTVFTDVTQALEHGEPYATGLGVTYEMAFGARKPEDAEIAATVTFVPCSEDVLFARILPGGEDVDWDAGAIPLFGSYSMRRRLTDGQEVTPLFLSGSDARQAVEEATPTSGEPPELRSLSLQQMVNDIVTGKVKNPDAIHFVAPSASVRYLRQIEDEALPESINPHVAMAAILDGSMDRQRTQSIFPS